ncbi:hypothetical protein MCEMIH15_01528 [Caulobacteraceae bacterium]
MKMTSVLSASVLAASAFGVATISHAAASKATSTATKTGEAVESPAMGASSTASASDRPVDVVVVWGFRVRAKMFDERRPPLVEGYGELIKKAECQTNVCGYVVFHDGTKWRYTNILAGDEDKLRELQASLEYDRQTIVIVHPNGEKRTVPNF